MSYGNVLPLASIEAVRPVFMIVMGIFLMIIAWRLSKCTNRWTARMIVSGSALLGFGYAVLLPLYEAGIIELPSKNGHYHGSQDVALAWHCVKLTTMNTGWLMFGLGVAMHARIFSPLAVRSRAKAKPQSKPLSARESIA